jgi:hypothetical protein
LNEKNESGAISDDRASGEPAVDTSDQIISSRSLIGDLAWGGAGAITFVLTASSLTVLVYLYGSLADVTPEFPLIFSRQFLLLSVAIMAGSPCVSVMAARRFAGVRLSMALPFGAGAGFLIAISLWFEANGAGGNPFDWPDMVWFLQTGLSGAAAGAVIGSGVSRCTDHGGIDEKVQAGRAVVLWKFLLALVLVVVLAMGLPFLFLRSAKNTFRDRAMEEAMSVFRLPREMRLSVVDEGSAIEAIGSNRRFKAHGNWEADGRTGTVIVTGMRNGFEVEPDSVSASLQSSGYPYQGLVDWDDTRSGSVAVMAVSELAGSYCLRPLEYKSTTGSDRRSRAVNLGGDGIVAVARPLRANDSSDGIYITFSIAGMNKESI